MFGQIAEDTHHDALPDHSLGNIHRTRNDGNNGLQKSKNDFTIKSGVGLQLFTELLLVAAALFELVGGTRQVMMEIDQALALVPTRSVSLHAS